MDFAEKVLAVSVTVVMACAMFCFGNAWAKVLDGKIDDNTAYQKVPVTYEQICDECAGWQQEADRQLALSADAIAKSEVAQMKYQECLAKKAEADALGVAPKVVEVEP